MLNHIFRSLPMTADFESAWLPTVINSREKSYARFRLSSIQFWWENVASGLASSVVLLGSNDIKSAATVATVHVSDGTNKADSLLLPFDAGSAFFKLRFISGEAISGSLNVVAYYTECTVTK